MPWVGALLILAMAGATACTGPEVEVRVRHPADGSIRAEAADREELPPCVERSPLPSVSRGRELAESHCAFGHQIAPDRPSDIEAATFSFMEIANQRGRERNYFRRFLATPHWIDTATPQPIIMPAFYLNEAEREDVIALILSYQARFQPGRPQRLTPFE
ncbi:MAG: hypothetical protein EXQ87_00315 [Alphaproteobacteria bacterium]|nr:hypothetical protein [Alphaproteobacteria bacterium]